MSETEDLFNSSKYQSYKLKKYFKVYGKEGQKVSGNEIKRVFQYGRSTFFCPDIQLMQNKKILKYWQKNIPKYKLVQNG